jgi:hypothetical protein
MVSNDAVDAPGGPEDGGDQDLALRDELVLRQLMCQLGA